MTREIDLNLLREQFAFSLISQFILFSFVWWRTYLADDKTIDRASVLREQTSLRISLVAFIYVNRSGRHGTLRSR